MGTHTAGREVAQPTEVLGDGTGREQGREGHEGLHDECSSASRMMDEGVAL